MNAQIVNQEATITAHYAVGKNYYLMELEAKACCSHMKPGQFLNIRPIGSHDPLLRRPMSIHQIDKQTGRFRILYQVVGRGTAQLNQMAYGNVVEILAPLGKEFPLPLDSEQRSQTVALIAGGIGIAPLYALAEELTEKGHTCVLFFGARTSDDFGVLQGFRDVGVQIITATEDGSDGNKGYITNGLEPLLTELGVESIYACGPMPMLKALQSVLQSLHIPVWFSLESHMACGVGACLGCTVKVRKPDGGWRYALLCQEGPVIAASEVIFDEQ